MNRPAFRHRPKVVHRLRRHHHHRKACRLRPRGSAFRRHCWSRHSPQAQAPPLRQRPL